MKVMHQLLPVQHLPERANTEPPRAALYSPGLSDLPDRYCLHVLKLENGFEENTRTPHHALHVPNATSATRPLTNHSAVAAITAGF